MRGQHHVQKPSSKHGRIIPARAGPTNWFTACAVSFSDHPRSCGANTPCAENIGYQDGSSPLVRGQHRCGVFGDCSIRIIPARAGPTGYRDTPSHVISDHPRSCGANNVIRNLRCRTSGSSPLVRGQRAQIRGHGVLRRIIPARAGPTVRSDRF